MKNCTVLADDRPLGRSIAHTGFIKKAEFSPDGTKLVTLDTGHSGGYEVINDFHNQIILVLRHEKTCLRGLRQVRLKPVCSTSESSYSHEILDIASIGIMLSKQRMFSKC